MVKSRKWTGIFAAAGMFILIFDGETAIEGCRSGLELCYRTVIPSLFPFIWINGILSSALIGQNISVIEVFSSLLGYPKGCSSVFISAVLGGYPSGAQAVGLCYESGKISKRSAERLLSIANNAGPAFLFGLISQLFCDPIAPWIIWSIQLLSAAAVSRVMLHDLSDTIVPVNLTQGRTYTLEDSVRTMLSICGWIILFRILISFTERFFPAGSYGALWAVLSGFLELTNGCCLLASIDDVSVRFILCNGMLSFGGLCILMQTASVTKGLNLSRYFIGKILQTFFSVFLSWIYMINPFIFLLGAILLIFANHIKAKIYYRNPAPHRV